MREQRVLFNEQMTPVSVVAGVLLENGRDRDYIFRRFGHELGFMPEEAAVEVDLAQHLIIIERYTPQRSEAA